MSVSRLILLQFQSMCLIPLAQEFNNLVVFGCNPRRQFFEVIILREKSKGSSKGAAEHFLLLPSPD